MQLQVHVEYQYIVYEILHTMVAFPANCKKILDTGVYMQKSEPVFQPKMKVFWAYRVRQTSQWHQNTNINKLNRHSNIRCPKTFSHWIISKKMIKRWSNRSLDNCCLTVICDHYRNHMMDSLGGVYLILFFCFFLSSIYFDKVINILHENIFDELQFCSSCVEKLTTNYC